MAMAFDVFDRDGRAFTAVVDIEESGWPVGWKADLWVQGKIVGTINGTCDTKDGVMAHVAAVARERQFHY